MGIFSNEFFFYVAIFFATFFLIVYLYFKHAFQYWKKLDVPYLEPKFWFGNCEETIKRKITLGEHVRDLYALMKHKGNIHAGFYLFNKPIYMPIHMDLIRNIMAKDFQHFYNRGVYHNEENDPLSAHLFSLEGTKWKNLRAKLTPTFTSGKLKKMFPIFMNCSQEMVEYLNEPVNKSEPIDIKQILVHYTTNVIGSSAFGIECNAFKDPNSDFSRLGHRIFKPLWIELWKLFFALLVPKLCDFFKLRVTNKEVEQFYCQLVKDTIKYRETNNIKRNDFMQLLIQLKNNEDLTDETQEPEEIDAKEQNDTAKTVLTINEMCAQAFLFFVAGFETSSTAMTFCLYELARNEDVQDKLREEIISVLKRYEGKCTYEAIMEMNYMDRVVQEALRKYPPLLLQQRVVTMQYCVPSSKVVLDKGCMVLIPVYAIHHDPEYYPDPERFDPDRFLEENKAKRPHFSYLPFGEGPRICIGARFAMMQVKVGLCQLLTNYKFSLNVETKTPLTFDPKSFVASASDTILLNVLRVNS